MIFELRALRSRLDVMIEHPGLFVDPDQLEWMWNVVNNLINKIERTGEYIADLEAAAADRAEAEAGLGPGFHDRDLDSLAARRSGGGRHAREV